MFTSTLRTYGSGLLPEIRDHANHTFESAVCTRSSASPWSCVSRYAVRSRREERAATYASKPSAPEPASGTGAPVRPTLASVRLLSSIVTPWQTGWPPAMVARPR